MMRFAQYLALVIVLISVGCKTRQPSCADHFLDGEPPVITSPNLSKRTTLLCFEAYATTFSGISRTPVWAAEHLTRKQVDAAGQLKRINSFHSEERLPVTERSELGDYVRSGFDRGHMAPSGDMPTENAQYESFSLANMIPQNPRNNQILWEGVEEAARQLAREVKEVYVVTGPLFEGNDLERINGRVLVPTAVYKAIYVPATQQAGAYVTSNTEGMAYQTLSLAELENRIHINIFPKLPADVKGTKMPLPVPTPHGRQAGKAKPIEVH